MNMEIINSRGIRPILTLWDTIDPWLDQESLSGILSSLAYLNLFNVQPFFSFSSVIDAENPSTMIGQFSQGGLSISDQTVYTDPSNKQLIQLYKDHITKMFSFMNVDNPSSWAQAVIDIETTIANFTVPADKLTNPFTTYNKLTLDSFKQLTSNLPWDSYFVWVAPNDVLGNLTMDVPSFMQNVGLLISGNSGAPGTFFRPYLKWQLLNSFAPLLSQNLRDEHFHFWNTILQGQKQPEALWRQCVSATDSSLGELLGKYWVELAFPGTSQQDAVNLLQGIIQSMTDDLKEIKWMDEITRAKALAKLSKVTDQIGSPKNPDDYSSVNITATTYFENVLNSLNYAVISNWQTIGSPKDPNSWEMTPYTVNAYYDPTKNQMVFPAGILQGVFFNHTFPIELQAGQVVMGHELTHGFDDQGRLYDGDGRLVDWWQPETAKKFEEKVECVIQQYSKYSPLPGVFVNGELTQGENIADMGGTKNAYRAVANALGSAINSPSFVPNFTRGQLFFVAFAQTWCEKATDEYLKNQVKTDVHSPAMFRVNGPFTNLVNFAETFNCPVGSPMNPTQRCEVW
eukprot:TRINITY_DN1643_c0_g1_i4.p1 TRINITY_DN1643_c0_g1~~TRINITY_DN1643_c0_g1_i4.p1  ORF type:complete len:570 (-),score=103.87 TRINITY_DN1643_c0_g1_i4:145-1854(-)